VRHSRIRGFASVFSGGELTEELKKVAVVRNRSKIPEPKETFLSAQSCIKARPWQVPHG